MRRRLLAPAIASCGLIAAACGGASRTASAPSGYLTYRDAAWGFRISYPPDWSELVGVGGGVVTVASAPESADDPYQENVSVAAEDLPNPGVSLGQFTATSLTRARDAIAGFRLVSSGPATLAERPAWRVVYRGEANGVQLQWESVWLVQQGRAYSVTYAAQPSRYRAMLPVATTIIDSFQL